MTLNGSNVIRVLLVDDSALFLEAMADVLAEEPDIQVVGTAVNGREAVDGVKALEPDLVAMDVMMPVMDGLEAVEEIMSSKPTPILLLTGDPRRQGAHWSFEALSRGALELMAKPRLMNAPHEEISSFLGHLKLLASVPVVYRRRRRSRPDQQEPVVLRRLSGSTRSSGIVGIVSSTGGPAVLAEILGALPAGFPMPILVVQHLAEDFAPRFVAWLDESSSLTVQLAEDGVVPASGHVYLAPDASQLLVDGDGALRVDRRAPPTDGHRPSGTTMLSSLASSCGASAVGLALSGMGSDGAEGLLAIRRAGGTCLAQDESTSVVFGIARAACNIGAVDRLLPRGEIALALRNLAARFQTTRSSA